MEIVNKEQKEQEETFKSWEANQRRGRVFGGFIFFTIGFLFLAREFGVDFPYWLLSWKTLLIVIGLYVGVKNQFRNLSWIILIGIGSAFLLEDFFPDFELGNFIWPIVIMIVGLVLILKPNHRRGERFHRKWQQNYQWRNAANEWHEKKNSDDYLEINTVFGTIKKNFISKKFSGGEINCVFSSCEVNLMNADFEEKAELEINIVFGGARLIVPANWEVRSELTAVLGGVDDKRTIQKDFGISETKLLVLRGTAVFGGIEIKNF
jgi:predicted membrane protein